MAAALILQIYFRASRVASLSLAGGIPGSVLAEPPDARTSVAISAASSGRF
jgi:hypothetical protein